jgi:hypothetical protein
MSYCVLGVRNGSRVGPPDFMPAAQAVQDDNFVPGGPLGIDDGSSMVPKLCC